MSSHCGSDAFLVQVCGGNAGLLASAGTNYKVYEDWATGKRVNCSY